MTNLQIELLKTFSIELSEKQILEIKSLLSKYFAEKVTVEMDTYCGDNDWTAETIRSLANEHLRTRYE